MLRALLPALLLVTAVSADEPTAGGAALPASQDGLTIAKKYTQPVTTIHFEHTGPYWSVGRALEQVARYMAAHELSGPMFAQYPDLPTAKPSGSVRLQVGFFTDGDHEPEPPFSRSQRDGGLVAWARLDPQRLTLPRATEAFEEWAKANDYAPSGGILEIYPDRTGSGSNDVWIEMQMPIKLRPPEEPAPPAGAAEQISEQVEQTESEADEADTGADQAEAASEAVSQDEVESPSEGRSEDQTQTRQGRDGRASNSAEAESSQKRHLKPLEPLRPVADLVREGNFNVVAIQLVPDADWLSEELQVWVGQVVHRINAVGRGARRVLAKDAEAVTRLTDPIGKRYEKVSARFTVDPLAAPVVRLDAKGDRQASGKQAVIRDLDRLMARLAIQSVDAEETARELTEVLERAQTIVRTSLPGATPETGKPMDGGGTEAEPAP